MYRIPVLSILVLLAVGFAIRDARVAEPCTEKTISIYNAAIGKVEKVRTICRTDAEWKKLLTREQYDIVRRKGTEPPGTCSIGDVTKAGLYQCVGCGTDLFRYDEKFESGTGWPSFWAPVSELNVRHKPDNSLGMKRTEVACARCDAHLGHVFDDGPRPTGKRYCINSIALKPAPSLEKATFAGGCFWGDESAFRKLLGKGVVSTRVGFTGGTVKNPTYQDVCSGRTGHLEAVEVTFDPAKVSYKTLLGIFWRNHNPYRSDGQGPDIGTQYRTAVFYHTPEQRKLAEESKAALEKANPSRGKVATMVLPAKAFYPAEDYHQQYFEKNRMAPVCPVY